MFDVGNRGRKIARSSEAASVEDISTIYPKAERHAQRHLVEKRKKEGMPLAPNGKRLQVGLMLRYQGPKKRWAYTIIFLLLSFRIMTLNFTLVTAVQVLLWETKNTALTF